MAGAWRWPLTPSSAEVKERVELYLYSTCGPSWLVIGRTSPLPSPGSYARGCNFRTWQCRCRQRLWRPQNAKWCSHVNSRSKWVCESDSLALLNHCLRSHSDTLKSMFLAYKALKEVLGVNRAETVKWILAVTVNYLVHCREASRLLRFRNNLLQGDRRSRTVKLKWIYFYKIEGQDMSFELVIQVWKVLSFNHLAPEFGI
jgi:hypothetical protein